MDGTIGGTQRVPKELLDSPLIDIFTNHYYGGDPKSVAKDAKEIASKNKVFIAGEFGFGDDLEYYKTFFETTLKTPEIAGSLIWSLRFHSIQGGFYVHNENDKWLSYHAPGFPESPGFHKEEKDLVPMVREYGLRIQGRDVYATPFPVPSRPSVVQGIRETPKELRWMGSAWAKGYNIERSNENGGEWVRIASNVPDNKETHQPLYTDAGVESATYRIQAIGVQGQTSEWLELGVLSN
jgi:hypothetical protein